MNIYVIIGNFICVYKCIYKCLCVYVHRYMCTYVGIHVCIYSYVRYIYIYIYPDNVLVSGLNWWINLPKLLESARDNIGKFIHQFKPKTKTLIKKLERILYYIDKMCLYYLVKHAYIYIIRRANPRGRRIKFKCLMSTAIDVSLICD